MISSFQAGRCTSVAERQNIWRYSSPEDGSDGLARRCGEGVHQGEPDVGVEKRELGVNFTNDLCKAFTREA